MFMVNDGKKCLSFANYNSLSSFKFTGLYMYTKMKKPKITKLATENQRVFQIYKSFSFRLNSAGLEYDRHSAKDLASSEMTHKVYIVIKIKKSCKGCELRNYNYIHAHHQ